MSNPAYRAYLASRVAHKKIRGVSITVSRGLNTSAPFMATVGFSGSSTFQADGSTLFSKNRDYLIDISAYNIGGEPVEPARYDIITEVINGVVKQYQVTQDGADDVFSKEDANLTVYRVHTKEI